MAAPLGDAQRDDRPATAVELAEIERAVDAWLADQQATNPAVATVERGEPGEHRWYVRMRGEAREVFAVWLTLRQRHLHHETYLMPSPIERSEELYERLLRANLDLRGVHLAIGAEDAVYLVGQVPVELLDARAIDAVLGTHYEAVERWFPIAMRIGFASVYQG